MLGACRFRSRCHSYSCWFAPSSRPDACGSGAPVRIGPSKCWRSVHGSGRKRPRGSGRHFLTYRFHYVLFLSFSFGIHALQTHAVHRGAPKLFIEVGPSSAASAYDSNIGSDATTKASARECSTGGWGGRGATSAARRDSCAPSPATRRAPSSGTPARRRWGFRQPTHLLSGWRSGRFSSLGGADGLLAWVAICSKVWCGGEAPASDASMAELARGDLGHRCVSIPLSAQSLGWLGRPFAGSATDACFLDF